MAGDFERALTGTLPKDRSERFKTRILVVGDFVDTCLSKCRIMLGSAALPDPRGHLLGDQKRCPAGCRDNVLSILGFLWEPFSDFLYLCWATSSKHLIEAFVVACFKSN